MMRVQAGRAHMYSGLEISIPFDSIGPRVGRPMRGRGPMNI